MKVKTEEGRAKRVALGIFLPPMIAATIFTFSLAVIEIVAGRAGFLGFSSLLVMYLFFVTGAYILSGVQAIVASVVLEYLVRPRVTTRLQYLFAAGVLGTLSGLIISPMNYPIMLIVGAVAGVLTGIVLLGYWAIYL